MHNVLLIVACAVGIGMPTFVWGGPPRGSSTTTVASPVGGNGGQTRGGTDKPLQNSGNCLRRLPPPLHGKVFSHSEFNISIHIYECEEHFILHGDFKVTCLYGVWEGQPATCIDSRCYGNDLNVTKGLAVKDIEVTPSGSRLNIKCIDGYHVGRTRPACLNGKWTEVKESPCIENPCAVPQISNGAITKIKDVEELSFTSNQYEEVYQSITTYVKENRYSIPAQDSEHFISCEKGYSFQGEGKNHMPFVCENGRWNLHPICLKNGTPYNRTNTTGVISSNILNSPQAAPVSNFNETESSEQDDCYCQLLVDDKQLQAVVRNVQLGFESKVQMGQTVKFHCSDIGFYRLEGESELTCRECRPWNSLEVPRCRPPQKGDTVIIFDRNFNVSNDGVLKIWKGKTGRLTCFSNDEIIPMWQHPSNNSNVNIRSETGYSGIPPTSHLDIMYADTENDGNYSCYGSSFRTSTVNVRVRDPQVWCPELKLDEKIRITYTDGLNLGSTALFYCFSPGVLSGRSHTTCLATGQWADEIPTCKVPRDWCPELKQDEMMEITYTNGLNWGSTARFYCFSPGVLSGISHTTCLESGQWADEIPTCRGVSCDLDSLFSILPRGVVPAFEMNNNFSMPSGSRLRLTCEENMQLIGKDKARCTKNGQWQVSSLECVSNCILDIPESSAVISNPQKGFYRIGETVAFSCPPGKVLSNDVYKMMCLRSGWTDDIPDCVIDW